MCKVIFCDRKYDDRSSTFDGCHLRYVQHGVDLCDGLFPMLATLLSFLTVEEVFGVLTPVPLGNSVGIGFIRSIDAVKRYLRVYKGRI